jgi:hypothetical protein
MKYRRISNIKSKRVKRVKRFKRAKKIRTKKKKRTVKRNKKRTKSRHVGGSQELSGMVYNRLTDDPKTELFSGGTNKEDLVIIAGHGAARQEYFVIPDNIDLYHYVGEGDELHLFPVNTSMVKLGHRVPPNTKSEIKSVISLMEEEKKTLDVAIKLCDKELKRIETLGQAQLSLDSTYFKDKEWTDIRSKLIRQRNYNVEILNDTRRDSPHTTPNHLLKALQVLFIADQVYTNAEISEKLTAIKDSLLIWLNRIEEEKKTHERILQYKKDRYILKYPGGGLCRDYTINFDLTWPNPNHEMKQWVYSGLLTSDQFSDEVSGMQVKDYIDKVTGSHMDIFQGEGALDEWRSKMTENMISKHNDNIMSRSDIRKSVVEDNRFKLSELMEKISDHAARVGKRIKVVGIFCRSMRETDLLLKEGCASWGPDIGLGTHHSSGTLDKFFEGNIEYEGVSDELMRQQSLSSNGIALNFKGIVEELNRLRPGLTTTLSLGSDDDRIFEELIQKMNEGESLSHEYACYIFDMIRKLELRRIITN